MISAEMQLCCAVQFRATCMVTHTQLGRSSWHLCHGSRERSPTRAHWILRTARVQRFLHRYILLEMRESYVISAVRTYNF